MIPSSRCIDLSQAWCDSIRARPALANSSRRCASVISSSTAAAVSAAESATRKCSPATASTPPAAALLVTTGTPVAIASRILFCVPRAIDSGATITAERCRYGRTSGTEPVTVTPGSSPSLRIAGIGIGADDQELRGRPLLADSRERLAAESIMHSWFG